MSLSIGILSPGQMGASLGWRILNSSPSSRLLTVVSDRSKRTQELARKAGFEDVSLSTLLNEADLILSVLVPSDALSLAESVAAAARQSSILKTRYFLDLNAIAPASAEKGAKSFEGIEGISFVDGGIIGGPSKGDYAPLIVLSGPGAEDVHQLLSPLFLSRTKVVGERVGQASALKLSYASLTKGLTALAYNSSLLSASWGVNDALEEELAASQPALLKNLKNIPASAAKAFRWVGEMEEISSAYGAVGLKGGAHVFEGIARTYEWVSQNEEVGKEKIEEALAKGRTHTEVVKILRKDLP